MIAPECIHELDPASCSVCSGRGEDTAPERDRSALGRPFAARYRGKCGWCGEWFAENAPIRADGQGSYVCEGCAS